MSASVTNFKTVPNVRQSCKMWRQIKIKHILASGIAISILMFLKPITLKFSSKKSLTNVKCYDAWDFMADFSKYPSMNPEIIKFDILKEEHEITGKWIYEVYYEEYFENLPKFLTNSAVAKYEVYREKVSLH